MQQPAMPVNEIAPLVNVGLLHAATVRTNERPRHLPGMIGFYGYAGWGKSFAAAFVANALDCFHIQILDFWNRKTFWTQLCIELGVHPVPATIGDMGGEVCKKLGMSQKPLIVDEADVAIKRGYIDDIRGIYEGSKTTVILIGEELLPDKLLKWEKIHSRILEWVPAQPPDLEDAATLVKRFGSDGIAIADDMVERIHLESGPSVRRICTNIERVQEFARESGLAVVDSSAWSAGGRELYRGAPPQRSAARVRR